MYKAHRCALLCIALLLTGCSMLLKSYDKSVGSTSGTVQIQGIKNEVAVRSDTLGIPYIEAKSEEDLYFATGYVMARERLWQMTVMKMAMQGRLSEIIGKDGLGVDIFCRTLDTKRLIKKTMAGLDPQMRSMLESFAGGVNAFIETNVNLPAEFSLVRYTPEKWMPEDCLYAFVMLNLSLSFNFIEELDFLMLAHELGYEKAAYLFPVYPDEDLPMDEVKKLASIPPGDLLLPAKEWRKVKNALPGMFSTGIPASNNWALSGARTASGKSIVCNDTHLELMIPSPWIIMHLKCPGYDAAGVLFPGIPLVTLGFNGKVAWGATMVMADSQDVFIEKMKEESGRRFYLYRGQWLPVETFTETFTIRGKKPVTYRLERTVHGPLLNTALEHLGFPPDISIMPLPFRSNYGIALSWAVEGISSTLEAVYSMARVKNALEARRALSGVQSIYLNFIYGDADSIGWQVSGAFPLRKKGRGLLPSPGWDGDYDWIGYLPGMYNPNATNPAYGYLATANHRTVGKNHPHVLSTSWFNPERAERLEQELSVMKGADADDMHRLQFDVHSPLAVKVQALLHEGDSAQKIRTAIGTWRDKARRDRAMEALGMLSPGSFDCGMSVESGPAAVLGAFVHCFTRAVFLDELGPDDGPLWEAFTGMNNISYSAPQDHLLRLEESAFYDDRKTAAKESKWDVVASALDGAVQLCEDRMGADRKAWRWGLLHTYHWRHEFTKKTSLFHDFLNRGPYPAPGDGHTLNVAEFTWGKDFNVQIIPAMRLVVDFGREEPAYLITAPGNSGNPSSPHYADMLPLYLEGRNNPLPFGRAKVNAQYREMFVMKPSR